MLCKGRSTLFCNNYAYRALADVASFTLPSWFPPSHCLQTRLSDLRGLMFETSMDRTIHCISSVPHCTPPTRCLSHQLGITAQGPSRHGIGRHCSHLYLSTLRQAEDLYRRALTGREDQLGPVHPDTLDSVFSLADLLEAKSSFAEARGVSVELWRCLGRLCVDQGKGM